MDDLLRLDGKIAMVTGASSGLGARFAAILAAAGAKVVLAARRTERLGELQSRIAADGLAKPYAVPLDVTKTARIPDIVATIEREYGPVDILVNNSGVTVTKKLVDHDEADYDFVMDTNLKGAFFVAQAIGRNMIAAHRAGRIINIASAAGMRPMAQIGVYSMSKAAVIHMTRAMAMEWGRHGINVNAICPGYVETDINREWWETDGGKKLIGMLPRRRVGKPEYLDGLLLLLASEHSSFINGAAIPADDGLTAG